MAAIDRVDYILLTKQVFKVTVSRTIASHHIGHATTHARTRTYTRALSLACLRISAALRLELDLVGANGETFTGLPQSSQQPPQRKNTDGDERGEVGQLGRMHLTFESSA